MYAVMKFIRKQNSYMQHKIACARVIAAHA